VPSSLSELYILMGIFGSCLSLVGSQSCLSLLYCVLLFFAIIFLFCSRRSIQAFKRPWLSIPEASSRSGLPVFSFVLEFIHTLGLCKCSPRVPALCYSSACVFPRVVSVTVAGLSGFFSIRVGQSSPPMVRSVPLRGLSLGLHSQ
jgi:hypothetical protein